VHLHRVGASSGTCGCICCEFSCYSWWLPPPRRLGAARLLSGGWCLSLAPIVVIVRGSYAYSPQEIAKGNSSKLLVACGFSLVVGSYSTLM
jgi:hypothetical protein